MAKAEATQATVQDAQPKRSVLGRLFRRPSKNVDSSSISTKSNDKKRYRTPSPKSSSDETSREEVPEMHPEATPPKPRNNETVVKKESKEETQPSARRSAFTGPPRYRWVDIETSAAIRVQAAYRRNKVMNAMERRGLTTSAIRNRARRREYQKELQKSEMSKLFTCCGAEFVFEGFAQSDYQAQQELKQLSKAAYEEKKTAQLQHEEELRNNFGKMMRKKKQKQQDKVDAEAYEVVE